MEDYISIVTAAVMLVNELTLWQTLGISLKLLVLLLPFAIAFRLSRKKL